MAESQNSMAPPSLRRFMAKRKVTSLRWIVLILMTSLATGSEFQKSTPFPQPTFQEQALAAWCLPFLRPLRAKRQIEPFFNQLLGLTPQQPKRILIVTAGTAGDTFPLIPIGQELVRRGHEVLFMAPERFKGAAEYVGLHFTPLGTEEQYAALLHEVKLSDNEDAVRKFLKAMGMTHRIVFEWIKDNLIPGKTVTVHNRWAPAALIAREIYDIPTLTALITPLPLWTTSRNSPRSVDYWMPRWLPPIVKRLMYHRISRGIDAKVAPAVNALREELGLRQPVSGIMNWWEYGLSPDRALLLLPPWFVQREKDWPSQLVQLGTPLPEYHETLSRALKEFLSSGPKPIVFTGGSGNMEVVAFFQESADAIQQTANRAVFVGPYSKMPPQLPAKQFFITDWVPFNTLFKEAAAVVHAGGIGTAFQALEAGVPQGIVWWVRDQPGNADILKKLGVAISMANKNYRGSRVIKFLTQLMTTPDLVKNSEVFSKLVQAEKQPSIEQAAQWIESATLKRAS